MRIDVEGLRAHDADKNERKEVLARGRPVHVQPPFRRQRTQPLTRETHRVESEAFLGGKKERRKGGT